MPAKKKSINFETKIRELETLVETMEAGNLSLDESLKAFEAGIKITRECQQALQEAEQKVEILSREKLSANEEPSAKKEPSAQKEPSANKESPAKSEQSE